MRKRLLAATLAAAVSAGSGAALADGHEAKVQAYVDSHLRGWVGAQDIIAAVDQQNIDHYGITPDEIERLDQRWRQEATRKGGTLIASRMENELAAFLRGVKAASGGVITEIFVMDNVGLNVGQTDMTGDFMQGDEAKWQKTYPVSAKAVFIDEAEQDGDKLVAQVSMTVARSNGARLGAVTIGIDVNALK